MNLLVAIAAIWFGAVLGIVIAFCTVAVVAHRRELNRQSNTWRVGQ